MCVFMHSCVLVQRTELGISCLLLLVSIPFYETAFIEIGTYYGLGWLTTKPQNLPVLSPSAGVTDIDCYTLLLHWSWDAHARVTNVMPT